MRMKTIALATVVLAAPLGAQESRFTKDMPAGNRLIIENINGEVRVTQGSGRTAEVVVTKDVRRGDGNLVKAIMEETDGGIRVCTIYLNKNPNRTSCKGDNNNSWGGKDKLEVTMTYVVKVPAGVRLDVGTVNGSVNVSGLDAPVEIETVNGSVYFEGASAKSLSTVNGQVKGIFTKASWEGELQIETVNGGVDLTFPAGLNARVSGETVNGGITSQFPVTIEGKWGPKALKGTIGTGGSVLTIETVNGGITLRKP